MNSTIEDQFQEVLHHMYINPLERCNLRCQICYTRKTSPILSQPAIIDFITRYQQTHLLQTITFCGGEVFALPYFPNLVNTLTNQGLFIQIITNGTIDKLDHIERPNLVNLIVSIDGLEQYHDKNRGKGNFHKSISFLKKGLILGFHTEVFSIVTKQNYHSIDKMEQYFNSYLGQSITVTYHPRKPPMYLLHHPISNIIGTVDGFDFLDNSEMIQLLKTRKTFPPKDLGCYQIAVASDGKVYGCCEGIVPLGNMTDHPEILINALRSRLEQWASLKEQIGCLGCSSPHFVCGIKQYLSQL